MDDSLCVTNVRFTAATGADRERGLLGFLSFDYGRLHLDGAALRRSAEGRVYVALPQRVDAAGRRHPIVRPLNDAARRALEAQVFAALDLKQETET